MSVVELLAQADAHRAAQVGLFMSYACERPFTLQLTAEEPLGKARPTLTIPGLNAPGLLSVAGDVYEVDAQRRKQLQREYKGVEKLIVIPDPVLRFAALVDAVVEMPRKRA